ncbi:pseudouridine-5'-phosphate glycosidase isoform X4 [Rhipicephalus microplus]|uniref:pseudouridine-5'-phosphate glycosidase isoform X4 n=1 Tax=Rhipicephalus microplus TaxID=6941 RepID=UPI003F6C67BF
MALKASMNTFIWRWPSRLHIHATQRRLVSKGLFVISDEVAAALNDVRPVVALETSIVTHGMPYPENISVQKELEDIVREHGAVPATVGVYCGSLHVGLDMKRLEHMAEVGTKAAKISRRDLPAALSKGLSGGTTVSATMVACNRAGIQLFATGGIGGVHRGGEFSLDISPDVMELGRSPVTVVSSGIKSILDIGRTLEVLETEGVCVATFGESQEFPAFFAIRSGHRAPWRVADATEAASLIESRNALHLDSGVLIAVPIPKEFEADGQAIEEVIQLAVREAEAADLTGNAVTPFILQKLTERTAGATLRANIALVKNNAAVAGDIASALAKIERENKRGSLFRPSIPRHPYPPVVIGGCVADIVVNCTEEVLQLNGSTHVGHIRTSWGGVGRNVADCLSRLLGDPVRLVSAVGIDTNGEALLKHNPLLDSAGVVRVEGARTASYCTLLDKRGDCLFGVGDMDVHRHISPQLVLENEEHIAHAPVVVLDGNVPVETISCVLRLCGQRRIPAPYNTPLHQKAQAPQLVVTGAQQGIHKSSSLAEVSPNLASVQLDSPRRYKNKAATAGSALSLHSTNKSSLNISWLMQVEGLEK